MKNGWINEINWFIQIFLTFKTQKWTVVILAIKFSHYIKNMMLPKRVFNTTLNQASPTDFWKRAEDLIASRMRNSQPLSPVAVSTVVFSGVEESDGGNMLSNSSCDLSSVTTCIKSKFIGFVCVTDILFQVWRNTQVSLTCAIYSQWFLKLSTEKKFILLYHWSRMCK